MGQVSYCVLNVKVKQVKTAHFGPISLLQDDN